MLKVGLAGVGGISAAHIPVWDIIEDAQLVAICDIRPEMMEKHPDKRHYTNVDEMLANEDLDILDVCLPTYLHVDTAVKAMEKGIHVVCEKPISLKAEDVERAYSAAKRNNVKFMVAQVLRFWPEYELIKELYDSKKYGKLLSGYMSRLGIGPKWSWDNWMMDPARSGLVPYDLHIHDLDFMVYAFGEPSNMQKHRCQRPEQDYISVLYEYPEFFITAETAWYAAPMPFAAGFRFQFEEALVVYKDEVCTIYENSGAVLNPNAAADDTIDTDSINLIQTNAYVAEIRYFVDCVLQDKFPEKVKPEELRAVINILDRF